MEMGILKIEFGMGWIAIMVAIGFAGAVLDVLGTHLIHRWQRQFSQLLTTFILSAILVVVSTFVHELIGHAATATALGGTVSSIVLKGVILNEVSYSYMPIEALATVAKAGSYAQVAFGCMCFLTWKRSWGIAGIMCISVALLQLMPIPGLDGGIAIGMY